VFLLCLAITVASRAQTFTSLVSFNQSYGQNPVGSLVQGFDGNFYGTTEVGGKNLAGEVFKITPSGTLTRLYSFCSLANCADGGFPLAGLALSSDGNFYGTTVGGGANTNPDCGAGRCGTVFKMTPSGTLTTLYSFCGQANCTDGANPVGLVQALDGNFYGTTELGGANNAGTTCSNSGCGTVFKITATGTLTTLYSFCSLASCADGAVPFAGLVQATNGSLYGTTRAGGSGGTVFKITTTGTLTTLYRFCSQTNCSDGEFPLAGLVQAENGDLYGTTARGGTSNHTTLCHNTGCGTVFKITPSGTLTTLYRFCAQANCTDGAEPEAGLVRATDGNFYGTTMWGGQNNGCGSQGSGCGTVFKITPSGTRTTLYSFCAQTSCADGSLADALFQATNGTFYGSTYKGGSPSKNGTIFSLSMGLGPFAETLPTAGKVGESVMILGTNLRGTTAVSFDGAAATFTVVSSSEIKTTVPTGATTGTVTVTTPSGTLKSNVAFRVP
jgi:uncharacterized repeat protein (TIGR03803 family)